MPKRCQCHPGCETLVKCKGYIYAKGHSPASHKGTPALLPPPDPHPCQCKPGCTALVKNPDRLYARGHAVTSHIMTDERTAAISKGRKKFFRKGGKAWWKGKKHKQETIEKLRGYHQNRPEGHVANFHEGMKRRSENPSWLAAHEVTSKKGNDAWRGKHHTKAAKMKIGAGVGRAVADRPIGPVHGTQGRIYSKKLGGVVTYRSPLERRFIEWLNLCEVIESAAYEPLAIPYNFEGRTRFYHPDFALFYKHVPWMVVEVKPRYILDSLSARELRKEKAKLVAAYAFCQKYGLRFMLVDEHWLQRRAV